jgi:hypothetical protein
MRFFDILIVLIMHFFAMQAEIMEMQKDEVIAFYQNLSL